MGGRGLLGAEFGFNSIGVQLRGSRRIIAAKLPLALGLRQEPNPTPRRLTTKDTKEHKEKKEDLDQEITALFRSPDHVRSSDASWVTGALDLPGLALKALRD